MQTDPVGYGDGINWYNYVGSDPVNRADPSGLDANGNVNGPSNVELPISNGGPIFVDGREPVFSFFDGLALTPNPGAGLGSIGVSGTINIATISLAVQSITKLPAKSKKRSGPIKPSSRLSPGALFNRFLKGEGETLCLTDGEFDDLVSIGNVRKSTRLSNGLLSQQVSYYGTPYENSLGTATIIRSGKNVPIQFYDFYDFDVGRGRSLKGEAATALGSFIGTVAGGQEFAISYNFGTCSRD